MMQSNRAIAIIWGIIYIVVAVAIIANFSGWWTHIVAMVLFGFALMAFDLL